MASATHPSNLVLIDAAVFDGRYEGLIRRRTAAEWLTIYAGDHKAGAAICGARDGQETSYRAADGVVWNFRRVG